MSVIIENVTHGALADAHGVADYTVGINNQPVIARFRHRRSDGLAACLRCAADTVDVQNGVTLSAPSSYAEGIEAAAKVAAEAYAAWWKQSKANGEIFREWVADGGIGSAPSFSLPALPDFIAAAIRSLSTTTGERGA